MAIALAEAQSGSSAPGTTVTTNAALTGGSDMAYVAVVTARASVAASSVSGGGLTWTKQVDQIAARGQVRSSLWTAYGSPVGTFTPSAVLASNTTTTFIVGRYTGVDNAVPLTGSVGWNTLGANGASSGGTDSNTACMTLISASDNSVNVFYSLTRSATVSSGASGYTRQASATAGTGGSTLNTYLYDKPIPTATTDIQNHTLSSTVDWSDTGIVLQPAGTVGGAARVPSPVMQPGLWGPI